MMNAITLRALRRTLTIVAVLVIGLLTIGTALASTSYGLGETDQPDISMVLDATGNPVVVYNPHVSLTVVHCRDAECYDRSVSQFVPGGGQYPSLVLDASGNPVISGTDGPNLTLTHCNDPDCSADAGGQESVAVVAPSGTNSSLALDASGNPMISFYDPGDQTVKLAHCSDPNCSGSISVSPLDTGGTNSFFGGFGRFTSLALDANGNPVVAYYYQPSGDLKLARCNDPDCAGGDESISTVDSAGDVGYYGSLALDANSNPVISYQDRTSWNDATLKLAHCNDANCAGGDESIVVVDGSSGQSVGWATSLKLDSHGNPVIGYINGFLTQLKTVHCNDANCAGSDEAFAIAGFGAVAADNSRTALALNTLDDPIVAYTNFGNIDAELATLWIDNGSFERPLDPLVDWQLASGEPDKDMRVCNDSAFPALIGACAFKFEVDGSEDVLKRTMEGGVSPAGNEFEVRANVRGINLVANGTYRIRVTVTYTDHTSDRFVADLPTGTYGYTRVILPFSPAKEYTGITVEIRVKGKGTLLVDNVQYFPVRFNP